MLPIYLNDPIFDNCAVFECTNEYEEPWDPDYSNGYLVLDLDKNPVYPYWQYNAVYEGASIPIPYSDYPKEDIFARLKAHVSLRP